MDLFKLVKQSINSNSSNLKKFNSVDFNAGHKITDLEIVKIEDDYMYLKYRPHQEVGLYSWNTKNGSLSEIIKPKYGSFEKIRNNRFIAQESFLKIGNPVRTLFDEMGKPIIELDSGDLIQNDDNTYIARAFTREILYDYDGNIILKYANINYLEPSIYKIKKGEKYGLAYNDKIIIKPKYDELELIDHHLYLVGINIKFKKKREMSQIKDGDYPYKWARVYGIIDHKGKTLIKPNYLHLEALNDGNYLVMCKNYKWKIIDKEEKIKKVFSSKYDYLSFNNNIGIALLNNKYGLVDINGNQITSFEYDNIQEFKDGLAIVTKDNLTGVINEQGNIVIPIIYQDISSFEGNVAIASIEGKDFLINKDGKVLTNNYDEIKYIDNVYKVKFQNQYGLIDQGGKEIVKVKYSSLSKMDKYLWRFRTEKRYGLVNIQGNEIVPPIYEEIHSAHLKDGLILLKTHTTSLFYSKTYYSLWNDKGMKYLKDIKLDFIHILNDEQVVINNYLFNVKDLKQTYNLDINIHGLSISKEFESNEKREKYIDLYNASLSKYIENIIEENEKVVEYVEKQKEKQIIQVLNRKI